MDELTIGDKTYVSTKKAAKLTGYAKDYVGQLSREGKVEARLVGRNWYVLESSILAHRFGENAQEVSEDEKTDIEPQSAKHVEKYDWISPTYTHEPAQTLPEIKRVETSAAEPISPEAKPPMKESSISAMQDAWKEWFESRKETSTEELNEEDAPFEVEADGVEEDYIEQEDYRSQEPVPVPVRAPEPVIIHRRQEYQDSRPNYEHYRPNVLHAKAEEEILPEIRVSQRTVTKKTIRRKRSSAETLVNIGLICIIGLLVLATFASVRAVTNNDSDSGNAFINFINGVSTVK